MLKLIVLAILFYVIYRAVTQKRIIVKPGDTTNSGRTPEHLEDEMVQDPYCKAYFPRQQGVALDYQNGTQLFCSQDCLDKFTAEIETTLNDSTNRRS